MGDKFPRLDEEKNCFSAEHKRRIYERVRRGDYHLNVWRNAFIGLSLYSIGLLFFTVVIAHKLVAYEQQDEQMPVANEGEMLISNDDVYEMYAKQATLRNFQPIDVFQLFLIAEARDDISMQYELLLLDESCPWQSMNDYRKFIEARQQQWIQAVETAQMVEQRLISPTRAEIIVRADEPFQITLVKDKSGIWRIPSQEVNEPIIADSETGRVD